MIERRARKKNWKMRINEIVFYKKKKKNSGFNNALLWGLKKLTENAFNNIMLFYAMHTIKIVIYETLYILFFFSFLFFFIY